MHVLLEYRIRLEANDVGGYDAWCPDVDNVFSQGRTRDEALANVKEVLRLLIRSNRDDAASDPDVVTITLDA